MPEPPYYPDVWPGEHYKLLAALVKTLKPKLIIEVGTALGHSALALKKFLPADSKLVTYDIFNWDSLEGTLLNNDDFSDGSLLQEIGDLAEDEDGVNGWELAGRYASVMLPQIFRIENPVLSIHFSPEHQRELEKLLEGLKTEVTILKAELLQYSLKKALGGV